MVIKINFDAPLIQIARICGCAPCQILALNGVRSENELVAGQQISVNVITEHMIDKAAQKK